MSVNQKQTARKKGDTLIEVVLALSIFATLAVMAIHTMNSGMYQAERAVEMTMARNEIDAQAEAIRFIQNNYVAEREYPEAKQQFSELWKSIVNNYTLEGDSFKTEDYDINARDIRTCDDAYEKQFGDRTSGVDLTKKVFAINTRLLEPSTALYDPTSLINDTTATYDDLLNEILINKSKKESNGQRYVLRPASLYPRGIFSVLSLGHIDDSSSLGPDDLDEDSEDSLAETKIYRKAEAIEGIWVIAVKGDKTAIVRAGENAEFFDFYIRTCWQAVGLDAPSTLTTIIRLYNPEVIE